MTREKSQGGGNLHLSLGGCLKQAVARGVILSAAKDLRAARQEILRCAQDDTSQLAGSFLKNLPVKGQPSLYPIRMGLAPALVR